MKPAQPARGTSTTRQLRSSTNEHKLRKAVAGDRTKSSTPEQTTMSNLRFSSSESRSLMKDSSTLFLTAAIIRDEMSVAVTCMPAAFAAMAYAVSYTHL